MDENIKSYKCPCCGSQLVFDAASGNLSCNSCKNVFSAETMQQLGEADASALQSKYDWENYTPRDFGEAESRDFSGYACPSCGAEVIGDNNMAATICPYCGNTQIVKKQFEGALRPDLIIPFKITKQQAIEQFEAACKKAPLLPKEFKNSKKIDEMTGIYVPFWLFDCRCRANMQFSAERVSSWSDSRYDYTKTDFYRIIRNGTIDFEKIPVDGSVKADDAYMDALEPFDYTAAVDFDTSYISGFLADRYDVSSKDSEPRANERVKRSTEKAFADTVLGYSIVNPISSAVSFSNGKIRYGLLPVWMMNIKYNGAVYKYAINGQTGKTVGKYPICKKKRNLWFFGVFAASFAVCFAVAKLFGLL